MRTPSAVLLISLTLAVSPDRLWPQGATSPGSWLVAGTAQVAGHRDIGNDRRTLLVELAPRIGYFVLPGLALNANLRAFVASYETANTFEWGLGPGATYYFRFSRRFYPFVSARTLFTRGHTRIKLDQSVRDDWSSSWLVGAGALAMLVSHVGVSAELFFQHDNFGIDLASGSAANQSEQYGLRFGLAAFLF